jgi:hypothetical protein
MRRASVETVDHRAASAASGRLASSACLAISASIDAISVILIYLLVGSSFVSSGRFKGQQSRSRLSEQILRVDKWSLCRD